MNEMMEEVIGELEVELDGRFSSIRNKETNLGKHTFSCLIMVVYWPYIYFLKVFAQANFQHFILPSKSFYSKFR